MTVPERPATDGPADDPVPSRAELHRPFAPARSRAVALTVAVAQAVILIGGAMLMPGSGAGAFALSDRLGISLVSVAIGAMLLRFALVRAVPSEDGLVVRNLFLTRDLQWAQIVAVRFGEGQPWVSLDLDDGDTLAVMGIQRSDGPAAQDQARRLATLVALHSRPERQG